MFRYFMGMLLLLPPVASGAACTEWNLAGTHSISQGNGFLVDLWLKQNDGVISGEAGYTEVVRNASEAYEVPKYAGVSGRINGTSVELDIEWGDGRVGVYSGSIDERGLLSGTTYERARPSNHVSWSTSNALECVPIPAKPVHRLGKIPPPAPRTPHDVLRAKAVGRDLVDHVAAAKARCVEGFVPRLASSEDLICVTIDSYNTVHMENRFPQALWFKGAYGDKSCLSGYVWREAFKGDKVCVKPERRDQVRQENRLAASRRRPPYPLGTQTPGD
jgi:hypothetical protein